MTVGDAGLPTRFGDYMLLRRIGAGGMAEVFHAELRGLAGFRRDVALKRILPQHCTNEAFVHGLLDEARVAGRLHHPNIAQVLNCGAHGASYFIVMELVAGVSLRTLLTRCKEENTTVSIDECVALSTALCRGLYAAHTATDTQGASMHIVHRDVSPENIQVTPSGEIKLLDFGIAKSLDRLQETTVPSAKGKYAYMAPEQIRNEPIDARVDQFAVGLVAFEMLAGRRAYQGKTKADLIQAVFGAELPDVSAEFAARACPHELASVITRALAEDPGGRYASCAELAKALQETVDFNPSAATAALAARLDGWFADVWASEQAEVIRSRRVAEERWSELPAGRRSDSLPALSTPVQPATEMLRREAPNEPPPASGALRSRTAVAMASVLTMGPLAVLLAFGGGTERSPRPSSPTTRTEGAGATQTTATANLPAASPPGPLHPILPELPEESPPWALPSAEPRRMRTIAIREKPTLKRVPMGHLNVGCVMWCEVYVDGVYVGTSPLRDHALPVGKHVIGAKQPGAPEQVEIVTVVEKQVLTVTFRF